MSSCGSPMGFAIPVRKSSKRGSSPDESLPELEEEQRFPSMEVRSAFKKVKRSGTFDFKCVNDSYELVTTKLVPCFNRRWTGRTEALSLKKRSIEDIYATLSELQQAR